VAVCDKGFTLSEKGKTKYRNGDHGYNNTIEEMRAIFMGNTLAF